MSTYDELTTGVITDMARENEEGITAAVQTAISLAIKHYETVPFWFLEGQANVLTTPNQEYSDLPSDFGATEHSISIQDDGNSYRLTKRTFQYLEGVNVGGSTFTGSPTDYALYKNQIRFYPVPDATYTASVSYTKVLGVPSANGSNAWTTDAELLIRSRVEWQLWALRMHDAEAASIAKSIEESVLQELVRKNAQRVSTGYPMKRRV